MLAHCAYCQQHYIAQIMIKTFLCVATLIALSIGSRAQQHNNTVKVVGAMKNVMWKGELFGNIYLDSIANKEHLYGFGPVEYLMGELMIFDGKAYQSTVLSSTTMKVENTYNVKAPFFAYANINQWNETSLPASVTTLAKLELYLDKITKKAKRPFMFKISGVVETATIHIVNLPKGSTVSSPQEAHKGQTNFSLNNEPVDIIGFFSTEHKAIFTHHDTFLHLHLLTVDKTKMGHLDEAVFSAKDVKLYLPVE